MAEEEQEEHDQDESYDGIDEVFDDDEIDEDDIDLGDLDEDVSDFDEEAPRSSGSVSDEDLLKSNYEQAVKANPKRAKKHQKRARVIEGVLDTAELGTEEGAAKAWKVLQKDAGGKPRKFKVTEEYTENDVINHPKFGEGYVVEILTAHKISVLFEDGVKKLAHNKG